MTNGTGLAAALAVDERPAKRRDLLLVLFQKPHRGADDLALDRRAGLESAFAMKRSKCSPRVTLVFLDMGKLRAECIRY